MTVNLIIYHNISSKMCLEALKIDKHTLYNQSINYTSKDDRNVSLVFFGLNESISFSVFHVWSLEETWHEARTSRALLGNYLSVFKCVYVFASPHCYYAIKTCDISHCSTLIVL